MENSKYGESIIATATITTKSENQDAAGQFTTETYKTVYVADGLGSFKYAQKASQAVVDCFAEADMQNAGHENFEQLFYSAKQKLEALATGAVPPGSIENDSLFGTTAIKACETGNMLSVAYVGNGGILHIRGNFNEFPWKNNIPWCITNYLNPHSIPEDGKEALYKLLSDASGPEEAVPTVFHFQKDLQYGDILIICTDGIYSADQFRLGKNEKGVWIKANPLLTKLYEHLVHFFKTVDLYDNAGLVQILRIYMSEIESLLVDDATVGVLITSEALNYQATFKSNIKHEGNPDT